MSLRRVALLRQILLFALFTFLGLATNYVADENHPPVGLCLLGQFSLPLAGGIAVAIIALMIWQHKEEEREDAGPEWDSHPASVPSLEPYTEQDAGMFFKRAETTELPDRLHPAGAGLGHRLIAVVGPSGVGKSSLVGAGLLPRLAQRRRKWLVEPAFVPRMTRSAALPTAFVANVRSRSGSCRRLADSGPPPFCVHTTSESQRGAGASYCAKPVHAAGVYVRA